MKIKPQPLSSHLKYQPKPWKKKVDHAKEGFPSKLFKAILKASDKK